MRLQAEQRRPGDAMASPGSKPCDGLGDDLDLHGRDGAAASVVAMPLLGWATPGENAPVHYRLTAHRRDTALTLLRPLHRGSASLMAAVPLGHAWAPVTRLMFDRDLPGV